MIFLGRKWGNRAKMAQNGQKACSNSIWGTTHDMIVVFYISEKWWYLQSCFLFFKNFDFLGQKGSKRSQRKRLRVKIAKRQKSCPKTISKKKKKNSLYHIIFPLKNKSLPILQWDTMIKVGFLYLVFYYYLFLCSFIFIIYR